MLRQLHRDLSLLEGGDADDDAGAGAGSGRSILDRIDSTRLVGGRETLSRLLTAPPLTDAAPLRLRQAALLELRGRGVGDGDGVGDGLSRGGEDDVRWLIGCHEDEVRRSHVRGAALYETWPLTLLNTRSPAALAALTAYRVALAPAVALLTPLVVYVLVPWLVMCAHARRIVSLAVTLRVAAETWWAAARRLLQRVLTAQGLLQCLSGLLSLAVYAHGVASSVATAVATVSVLRELRSRGEGARAFARGVRDAARRLLKGEGAANALARWSALPAPGDDADAVLSDLRAAAAWTFGDEAGAGAAKAASGGIDVGAGLRDVAAFDCGAAHAALRTAWRLDAAGAVLRLLSCPHGGWCLPRFEGPSDGEAAAPPRLELRGVWHPALPPERAVRNDWVIGTAAGAPNVLVTGPNAGGKSTLMKAALCCALMSQTIGVAPCADACALTPFETIVSHLRAADSSAGSRSLFEAEMDRAQAALAALRAEPSRRTLVVMDEMFSSTNAVEGTAAAAAVAAQLARFPGTLAVLSTHHLHLADALAEACPGRFACFGMPVVLDARTGEMLSRPFRLAPGLCRQHVAIELLRGAGFDGTLVGEAVRIKAWVLRRSHPPDPSAEKLTTTPSQGQLTPAAEPRPATPATAAAAAAEATAPAAAAEATAPAAAAEAAADATADATDGADPPEPAAELSNVGTAHNNMT